MLCHELPIHEIMPFDVLFLFVKNERKKGKKEKPKKQKRTETKKTKNKRQIQLISFSCGKYFAIKGLEC